MDKILLNERQKVGAAREAPGFWTPIMVRMIYIILRKWVSKRLKKQLNDVGVRLNEKRKNHMGLKSEMIWRVYMTKK